LSGYYNQRPNSSQPSSLFVFNNKLFFNACDSIHGCELWALDELSNLSLIVDLNPGDQSSGPSQFSIYNNNLYFSASDGLHPKLLWVFDGIQNPRIAGDTGNLATYPCELTAFNNLLYFSADDYSTFGRELWAYDELLTNVSDAIVENKIAIFPIPTKDVVNIVLSGFDNKNIILEICNIQGQTLEFLPLNSINLNSLRVDLSNYSNGIYFAKIRNENFIKVVKVVKN
jgi:ELWxxDGT repeat protein